MRSSVCLWVSVVVLLFVAPQFVSANDTSLNVGLFPPRPVAEGETPVRMKAERLKIFFGWHKTRVEVEFDLENLSQEEYSGWVGFPDEDLFVKYLLYGANGDQSAMQSAFGPNPDSYPTYTEDYVGQIENFKAWLLTPTGASTKTRVDLPVKILRIVRMVSALEDSSSFPLGNWQPGSGENDMPPSSLTVCRAFQLSWQPRQTLTVGHSYEAGNGGNVLGQILFQYTLATGKNWSGTIGSADIDVYLEDGLTADDVYFGGEGSQEYSATSSPSRKQWTAVTGTHLALKWKDFEPEGDRSGIFIATVDGAHLSLKPALRKNMPQEDIERYDRERKGQ